MTRLKKLIAGVMLFISITPFCFSQVKWVNVDSLYAPLPSSIHVYKTTDSINGKPNIAFYVIADLKDKRLDFTVDTTNRRRITPSEFYERNKQPLLVVNCNFFSYETNNSVNVIVKEGKMLNYNVHTIPLRGKDTFNYYHPLRSAIGISKKRKADVAWTFADSNMKSYPVAFQKKPMLLKNKSNIADVIDFAPFLLHYLFSITLLNGVDPKWKMKTVIGGGPVLLRNGQIQITNDEELMFAGKAKDNLEPRTAMGYTADDKLVILMVQGRYKGIAEGLSLPQIARIFQELGCIEALNLDGGGSSCLLINGKETIKPSSAGVQRAVPAVFLIHSLHRKVN
jgi:Phosphodiester glycosidase